MKTFLKLTLVLFFFGLTGEQEQSICNIEEKCQLGKNELLAYEDSGKYHLLNFHRIEYSDLEKDELFSVRRKVNSKLNLSLVIGKVITY
ncbi:hypothetical protein [Algoriphagus sp.]|uniref:hypothetical protein n=1 Tax=Algoriphagus sp. TaxID=1872435 RepID=UPI0025EFB3F6|nr:hypothetical protein [Algoriphagus sp.]